MRIHQLLPWMAAVACLTACTTTATDASDRKATTTMPAATASPDRIFDMPYLMRDLDNGLRVIVVRTDYPDVVNLQIPVQSGSRNEVEPGKSGFAHFFEHMMFRGTDNYSADEYAAILKNAGADQNAYTTDDYTNYHITFTKPDLEKILELEADRFMNLSYSEEQFRTEALAVKGEYLKNFSNPVQGIFEAAREMSFESHPYKHTTMGFLRDIEEMPNQMEYSKIFFDRWYRPEKSAVIVVGDVDPEQTFAMVKKYFGPWERGTYEASIPADPPPSGPLYKHLNWEAPTQPWLVTMFRGPAFDPTSKAMPAMDLLSELYFSNNSDIYQKLVIQEQLVDQMFAYFPDRKDPNLLMIATRLTSDENAMAVREAIASTVVRARTETVDTDKIESTKSRLRYGFTARMDNSEAIGEIMAQFVQFERDPEVINRVYDRYRELTATDLRDYANRYFVESGQSTVTLSNQATLAGVGANWGIDAAVAEAMARPTPDIRIVSAPSASAPLVDVALLFNTGAAYDPPGKKGLAAITAAMITDGGSETRSIQEINQALYPIAAGFDAQVDKEMVRLSGSVHKDNLDTWYGLAMDQLLNPGWRQEDFERIKTRQKNNIRTDLVGNNDEELGKEVLYSLIYRSGHPYGEPNLGRSDDIDSLTLDDVTAFYRRHFVAENLTIGLAGGFDKDFESRLIGDMSRLPSGSRNALALPAPAAIAGHQATIIEKETPAVAVSFGFPIDVRRGDPDWVALWLLRSWLGEHRSFNSHLYQRIREARGMNYGDYAYIEYFPRGMFQFHPDANLGRQQQIFQVWIRPLRNNNDAHFATRAAIFEMDKMLRNGLTEGQFMATRNYLEKFVSLLVKTQSRQLGYQLDSDYYGTAAFTEYVREGLARLTVDDVNRVARRHLQTRNIQFAFITKDAADLRDRLVSDSASPLEYNTPKPELADEDALIQALPLGFDAASVSVVAADAVFR